MSYYGVKLNGVDLYTEKGLILLADYTIEEATPKENWIDVPGANGAIDGSRALTGYPVYNTRGISWAMGIRATDAELTALRDYLHTNFHGRTCELSFPWDTDHHYTGLLHVGEMSGYNSCTIPFSMTAQPYRLKNADTVALKPFGTSWTTITLTNESMRVIPTITVDKDAYVEFDGDQYAVAVGPHRISTIAFGPGTSTIKIKTQSSSGSGTVEIRYREGCL